MSNTESQEKGSSSEDKDLFNPKNVTEHAETRYERFIEHIEQPGWNNTCNWGWWRISKIPIPWDSEEKKENTTTVKKIRFEVIPGEAQNNWEVTDGITKFAKKYFEKYVSDKELKNSMTLNSPVLRNVSKAKTMDEYFVKLLEHQKEEGDCPGQYFQENTVKNTNDYRSPKQSVVHSGGVTGRSFQEIWWWQDVTIYWSNRTANSTSIRFCVLQQTYECIDWRENRKSEGHEHSKTRSLLSKTIPKNFLAGQFRSTWQLQLRQRKSLRKYIGRIVGITVTKRSF